MKALIVIPARGGSKGIPRKNLRFMAGKPLVQYAIETALQVSPDVDVVVTTDDQEITLLANVLGANSLERPEDLCRDDIPLDPVIFHAYEKMQARTGKTFDYIITMQPTSPFISSGTVRSAIQIMESKGADTLFSVVDETHLCWTIDETSNKCIPMYKERLNRQWLPKQFKETGSIQICSRNVISNDSRIGSKVELYELGEIEGIDIDTPYQWTFCESIARRKKWIFVVAGDKLTGSGHAFRVKTIAEFLAGEDLQFLCLPGADLAKRILEESNFKVTSLKEGDLAAQVIANQPDIVMNDILDTEGSYIDGLRKYGALVANFEDFGEGADKADVVINALYHDDDDRREHVFYGLDYFCLRNEFRFSKRFEVNERVQEILLTFGGTDPGNLTIKTIKAIKEYCYLQGIRVKVIVGPGYSHMEELERLCADISNEVNILNSVKVMSTHMRDADICITSCGRTVYELTSLGVPTICLAQNQRETTHTFARRENGIEYLGLGSEASLDQILRAVKTYAETPLLRGMASKVLLNHKLRDGTQNVVNLIRAFFAKRR